MSVRETLSRPLGLRREVAILVPASLLLLLALAGVTLLSYRGALDLLVETRRGEALAVARAAAAEIAAGSPGAAELSSLRRRLPAVRSAVLVDPAGNVVAMSGEEPAGGFPGPFRDPPPAASDLAGTVGEGRTAGPGAVLPRTVAALVPVRSAGGPLLLRVDLDAAVLAGQRRGLRVLTVVVLVVGLGAVALLVLFLRQLLRPWDAMLARARQLSGGDGGETWEDEVTLLVRTFERGMAALATGAPEEPSTAAGGERDQDLVALQRTLLVSLESGLLLLDREGRVIGLNPVGSELLGVAEPEPGEPLEEVLERHPDLVRLLAGTLDRGRALQRHELTLPAAGGEGGRTLGLSVHPLRRSRPEGGEAEVRGFLVLFADLTEARRRGEEARLAENLARLGELAAGVAHELRNSLATIRGYLALVERHPDEPPAGYLDEVRREADHLQRVLEDFLSFARPGGVRAEEVSLVAIARRAALDPALEGAPVEVVEDLPASGADRLRGDPQLLERAVRNLLRNAVEAQREAAGSGPVTVRVGRGAPPASGGQGVAKPGEGPGEGVVLLVEDRGPGVSPEVADRLFHPFVTGRPGGVGLGLALSQRIVLLHGGRLQLDPRPGGGTRAWLWLPAGRSVTKGNESAGPAASS